MQSSIELCDVRGRERELEKKKRKKVTFFFLGGALKTEKRRDIIVVGEPSRPPTTTILPSALSPRPNEAAQGPSCEAVAGCCRRRCGDGGDACKARASSRRRGSAQPTRLVEGGLGRPLPPSLTLSLSKRPAQGPKDLLSKAQPRCRSLGAPRRLSPPVGREAVAEEEDKGRAETDRRQRTKAVPGGSSRRRPVPSPPSSSATAHASPRNPSPKEKGPGSLSHVRRETLARRDESAPLAASGAPAAFAFLSVGAKTKRSRSSTSTDVDDAAKMQQVIDVLRLLFLLRAQGAGGYRGVRH